MSGKLLLMLRRVYVPGVAACLMAVAASAQDVNVHANVAYKSGDSLEAYERERAVLDLYLPEGRGGFPVIVWFHGAGLTAGR